VTKKYHYIIIGAGIMGMAIARCLKQKLPHTSILIIDKEPHEAAHASSRNSGVLHAGFYYTSDTVKAKFTIAGNHAMKRFCEEKGLAVNNCGKLVVAQNEAELQKLYELERRGQQNGSMVSLIDAQEAKTIEPNVRTYKKALYSPQTSSVDPQAVCKALRQELEDTGVVFSFETKYLGHKNQTILTNKGTFEAGMLINCAGLYAETIAHDFGFGQKYTLIPFKGLYLKYTKNKTDVRTHIYPVPNLKNPFLGVHFTKTVYGDIKIGPTAIPAFWREHYGHLHNFRLNELLSIGLQETKLFLTNAFGFRDLAWEEMKKYNRNYFIQLAQQMVETIDPNGFTETTPPGIRAQLLDKTTLKLVMDFLVEGDHHSIHLLNSISPAFTCSLPLAEYITQKHIISN
jgi:L-2-hydroxyglutarate oxidase LhgO